MRRISTVLFAAALCPVLACEPLANVRLQLVEPCDQRDSALNGVLSLQLSHDGPGDANSVSFSLSAPPETLTMGELADDVVVTVSGYEGDVATDGASVLSDPPKSIGRTMPLDIDENTPDVEIVVNMGILDGFGQATDVEGTCQFSSNGHPSVPGRHAHTATFVPALNKVLIAGGAVWVDDGTGNRGETFLRSAELFDPAAGTFEALPDMGTTRGYHTATALPPNDNLPQGGVLLVGGFGVISGEIQALTNGIIYDPSAPLDDPFRIVQFSQQRALHTATLLEEQLLVVVAGGCNSTGCLPTGVLDPGDGDPTRAPKMLNPIEVYDIVNNDVTSIPNALNTPRALHAASSLEGGRVLLSGGVNADGPVCDIEVFESAGGTLVPLPPPGVATFSSCPSRHAQVTIGRDRIAFIGGQTSAPGGVPQGAGSDLVQFWNTAVGVERDTSTTLLSGRYAHGASLLADGSLLVVGGEVAAGGASAERLTPTGETFDAVPLDGPPLRESRQSLAVTTFPPGVNMVMVSGGHTSQTSSDAVDLYYGD
jgi:hypothetical protein